MKANDSNRFSPKLHLTRFALCPNVDNGFSLCIDNKRNFERP